MPRHDDAEWDDGGTPQWRDRHAPQTIDIYPNRRAAFRDLMRKKPMTGLWLGVIAAIALYMFFALEFVGFLTYALICRLLGYG